MRTVQKGFPAWRMIAAASMMAGFLVAPASANDDPQPTNGVSMIPNPLSVERLEGAFQLDGKTTIRVKPASPEIIDTARYLAANIKDQVGISVAVAEGDAGDSPGILLTTEGADRSLGEEGYNLRVSVDGIVLRANTAKGVFWGVQSIRQLLPVGKTDTVTIEGVNILDKPRFPWRGMHLDVGRHFMPVEFVKRYIDLLAYHKLNTFHWHLTEDQGWRIEIKKYPKLTEVAAWRTQEDGSRYGGFYTQDEIREVVAYAASRHITVVPEIEMPGHTKAVLAAYPELSCTGGPFEVPAKWGIFEDVFCAGNDQTFKFLEDVLEEVMPLFPGEFFHVGGDECPKARWKECAKCQQRIKDEGLASEDELQSWFIKRMARFLASHEKRLVGWDEILEGGLAPSATVMSWRGNKGGIKAAQMGHDVVMSPTTHCYFDYRQADGPDEGGSPHAPKLTLETVYEFDPIPPELSPEEGKYVLGGQANVWTERIPTPQRVEYMAFPRTCALAEAVWSVPERRDWDDFHRRLKVHLQRLEAMKVNFRRLD